MNMEKGVFKGLL